MVPDCPYGVPCSFHKILETPSSENYLMRASAGVLNPVLSKAGGGSNLILRWVLAQGSVSGYPVWWLSACLVLHTCRDVKSLVIFFSLCQDFNQMFFFYSDQRLLGGEIGNL